MSKKSTSALPKLVKIRPVDRVGVKNKLKKVTVFHLFPLSNKSTAEL